MSRQTAQMRIDDIKVGSRIRKDIGNLVELMGSITSNGLLHPVVVRPDGTLIAGLRRLRACELLGWENIPVTVIDVKDAMGAELDENVVRKNLTPDEIVTVRRALEPGLKEEAEKRAKVAQKEAGKNVHKGTPKVGVKFTPTFDEQKSTSTFAKEKTRDLIAKAVGISGVQLDKLTKVADAASEKPDKYNPLWQRVNEGKTSVDAAYTQVVREERRRVEVPLPKGQFDVFYADPPWQYAVKLRGSPDEHYSTMSLQELMALGPKLPAAADAVLFMWATAPMLADALQLMHSWGFSYKTNAVWVKQKFGTGHYFRGMHELLLLGIKGNPGTPDASVRPRSVIQAAAGEHSSKPDGVYGMIEAMYPGRRYLELFARTKREGWEAWGDQIYR